MSDRACPFGFAVATFSRKVLIATLLFDDRYVPQPAEYSEDKGKCLQDFLTFLFLVILQSLSWEAFYIFPFHFPVFKILSAR